MKSEKLRLRSILSFVRMNPWSTLAEIAAGTEMSEQKVLEIITTDLLLQKADVRTTDGQTSTVYALSVP